jgi:hypothetical protein
MQDIDRQDNTRTTGRGARGRNRTGMALRPRDFKSLVSTSFTTRALGMIVSERHLLEAGVGIEPA